MTSLVVAMLLTAAPDACRDAYDAVRYRDAVELCLTAVPTAPAEQLAGLYRVLGMSLATVGDEERATAAFASLLALDSAADLPGLASPKLRAPFEAARRAHAPVLLTARLVHPARADRPVALEVEVKDGGLKPVARLVAKSSNDERRAARADRPVRLDLGPPGRSGLMVAQVGALDRFGGRLATVPISVDVAPVRPPRPLLLSWKAWGVASLVVGAGAAGTGVWASHVAADARAMAFADDAANRMGTARGAALAAEIAGGVALALAGGAVILWATDPPREL